MAPLGQSALPKAQTLLTDVCVETPALLLLSYICLTYWARPMWGENWLNANTEQISPPAALFLWQQEQCVLVCKKPALPHAYRKPFGVFLYDSQGTITRHGRTPRSLESERRQAEAEFTLAGLPLGWLIGLQHRRPERRTGTLGPADSSNWWQNNSRTQTLFIKESVPYRAFFP